MSGDLVALLYLAAGVLFILALRGLSSPETSRQGNYMGMAGMAIAVATTLAVAQPESALSWAMIVGGIAVGGAIGAKLAIDRFGGSVQVTGTPAEELYGGKVIMTERGAFDSVDVAMMVHPGSHNAAVTPSLAC